MMTVKDLIKVLGDFPPDDSVAILPDNAEISAKICRCGIALDGGWLVMNLKTGDRAENSVKKMWGELTMTDKDAIECADKLGTYCRGKDCEECPFYDSYNDCTLELERPGMWDLEYLLKEGEDDD